MGTAGIKSRYDLPILVPAKRELCLVAVSPWMFHTHDGQHVNFLPAKPSDPHQIVKHLPLLKPKLLFIAHGLKLAPAAPACHGAGRLHPAAGRFQHLHQACKTI